MDEPSAFEREPYLYLTTRGRTSGVQREIEIWFTHLDGRFYVIAEYATSQWVQNIRAQNEEMVRVAGQSFPARTRLVSEERQADLWRALQQLSRKKYGWGDGLIVELTPGS